MKKAIGTIAERNRIIENIIHSMTEQDGFLLVGHKNPDDDCIASMVAFSLLLSKFNKQAWLLLPSRVHDHFQYLLNICRYNSIQILDTKSPEPENISAVYFFDTPKPSMIEHTTWLSALLKREDIRKGEVDHHLEADSAYSGDQGYRYVDEAISSSELVGLIGLKLRKHQDILDTYHVMDLFSRNFVLAVLTGIIGDSRMGKYLKTKKDKWFYSVFSRMFNEMLITKTHKNSGNFSSMEEVFSALEQLSEEEDNLFRFMIRKADKTMERIYSVILDRKEMAGLYKKHSQDVIIAVAKFTADKLAEESGYLSLVVYYDDPNISPLVQFRMRRSQSFKDLDLRTVLDRFGIENGGGHPGAIGFRVDKDQISDINKFVKDIKNGTEEMIGLKG